MSQDSSDILKLIDPAATAFEQAVRAAWKSNTEPPSIEEWLVLSTDVPRKPLLAALLTIEMELQLARLTTHQPEGYRRRFPDDTAIVDDAIHRAMGGILNSPPAQTLNLRLLSDDDAQSITVQQYQLRKELGKGGVGRVFEAWDPVQQKDVALKFLFEGSSASDNVLHRFTTEYQTAKRLQHDNIVPVYSLGADRGCVFIVMQAIDGVTLKSAVVDRVFSPVAAAKLLSTLAAAMQYTHEQGVLHRDITPNNILIDQDNKPWIADFGFARDLMAASGPTQTGEQFGTVAYMSPEQAVARISDMDARSDVYALGAVLYFASTGRAPFAGVSEQRTIDEIVSGPLPTFAASLKVPRPLQMICHKCLRKRQGARYQSAQELADDLKRFLDRHPILARAEPILDVVWQWCRRSPWRAVTAVMAILLAVGGTLFGVAMDVERRAAIESANIADKARLDAVDAESVAQQRQLQSWARLARLVADGLIGNDRLADLHEYPGSVPLDTGWLKEELLSRVNVTSTFLHGDYPVLDASLSPDQTLLAMADLSGNLQIVDAATGLLQISLRTGFWYDSKRRWKSATELSDEEAADVITSIDWKNQDSLVATTQDGRLLRYTVSSGELSGTIHNAGQPLHFVRCDPDSQQTLIVAADGTLSLLADSDASVQSSFSSDDGVTTIERSPRTSAWLVGYTSGRMDIFDSKLMRLHTQQFAAPIVAIHDTSIDRNIRFLLCAGNEAVQHLEFDSTQSGLRTIQTYDVRNHRADRTFQSVASSAQFVMAQDTVGQAIVWNLASGTVLDDFILGPRGVRDSDRPPPDLQRSVIHIFAKSDDRFMTVDGTGVGAFLQRDDDSVFDWKLLTTRLGKDCQLAAIPDTTGQFWSLSTNGRLQFIDAISDTAIAEYENAHAGGYAEVVCLSDGTAVTAGGDHFLKTWRLTDGAIVEVPARRFEHSANLLSVAVSEKSGMVAAVDEHSILLVWDTHGEQRSKQPRRRQIEDPDQPPPLTGRVAFNCNGTLLSAFGSGQTRVIVDAETLEDVEQSGGQVAGAGGVTVTWSPVNPYCCVHASKTSYSAVVIDHATDPFLTQRVERIAMSGTNVIDSTATADAQRMVVLERSGTLRFLSGSHFIETSTWTIPGDNCCSVAIGGTNECVVVAAGDGRVFRKMARQTVPIPEFTHDTVPTTRHELISPADGQAFETSHRAAVNASGQGILPVLVKPSQHHHAGEPKLVRFRDNAWRLDPVGTHQLNGMAGVHDMGVAFDQQQRPYVAFREMVGDPEGYDAQLVLALETSSGKWQTEVVAPVGNAGHYALLRTDQQGQVSDLFHFNFAGYSLQHSQRSATTNERWKTSAVRQGFGIQMNQWLSDGDDVLIFGKRNRFTFDQAPRQWLRLAPDGSTTFPDGTNDLRFLGQNRDTYVFATGQFPNVPIEHSLQVELPVSLRNANYLVLPSSPVLPSATESKNIILAIMHSGTGRLFLYSLVSGQWKTLELNSHRNPGDWLASAWVEGHNRAVVLVGSRESNHLTVITARLPAGFLTENGAGN